VFSLVLGCQHDTARIILLLIAVCLHGAQQQTRRTPLPLSIDGTAYYAGSVNKCSGQNTDRKVCWTKNPVVPWIQSNLCGELAMNNITERPQTLALTCWSGVPRPPPTSRHSVQNRSTCRAVKAVVSTDSAPDLVISSKYWETVSLPVGSHGLNGQHPDVDCTLRGRVNQNDREQR